MSFYLTSRLIFQQSKLSDVLRFCGVRFFCDNPTLRLSQRPAFPSFGVLLDIDGVLVRGRKPIPGAREALEMLRQAEVPSVFLTNGGCESEKEAAERLSDKIGFEVREDQMVLSHTPLKMFNWLHKKHVLISGQQNIKEIIQGYGFTKVSDIEDVRKAYPLLDMVDRERRYDQINLGIPVEELPPIEAVLLLGEPVRWETNLQLIVDLLVTSGSPSSSSTTSNEHIPVIAVNTDLLYMAEAPLPRFGHGAFLMCLEALYKKLTGNKLIYTALLGKPNLASYQYAEHCLLNQVNESSSSQINSLYAIGDNLDTDIYGANMCNEYLKAFHETDKDRIINHFTRTSVEVKGNAAMKWMPEVRRIESILVHTGVSSQDGENPPNSEGARFQHRDILFQPHLRRACHVVDDVTAAVELILKMEQGCS
ncbi:haloacid dehalogenase-like hydrolase domain-containing 5 [Montipora foliosa]|uniref:haloacid dehalogenase-like hydrolase domain-containing 5 n=1 Tax=Montipora foliosa TaxID=591990 RepID=UPI0035F1996E